jgi:hypothetical protein
MIAIEPVTKTALRRPGVAEAQTHGQTARDRYIEIAAALKAEAGVKQLTEHKKINARPGWTAVTSSPRRGLQAGDSVV